MESTNKNAIVAEITAAVMQTLMAKGLIELDEQKPKKAKPTKRLPDGKSATISDILSDAKAEARENGKKVYDVHEKELTIMEYSERSYAIVGDTKGLKDFLKERGAYRYAVVYGFADNTAKGWLVSKKKFDEACKGLEAFKRDMDSKGYHVTIGESLKAINEAYKAEHPREEKGEKQEKAEKKARKNETKVVPIQQQESFEGIGYTPKGTVKGEFEHTVMDNVFKHDNGFYMCIGFDNGENNFLFVAGGNIENDKQKMERIATIAKEGLPQAYSKGIVKKIYQWQMDAYKVADKESYEWLKSHVTEVSA